MLCACAAGYFRKCDDERAMEAVTLDSEASPPEIPEAVTNEWHHHPPHHDQREEGQSDASTPHLLLSIHATVDAGFCFPLRTRAC